MSTNTVSTSSAGAARPHLLAAALAITACGAGETVSASDGVNNWMRFNGAAIETSSTAQQSYDRSFVKEWEANPPRGFPTLSASNNEPMKAAVKRYAAIVEQGGFKLVPEQQIQVGSNGPAVEALRERLAQSGDLKDESSFAGHFDYYLEKAVKRFQASNGLTPTGIVEKRTVAALNVPAAARLKQLKVNQARLLELSRSAGKKYVLVNIPAAQIEAVEGDRVVSRHAGVVGKIDRPTPILRSAVHQMNFNPVWTLPPTVIEKDLIPKGQEMQRRNNQSVLLKFGIEAFDGNGKKLDPTSINWSSGTPRNLQYRQQPGKENPLGFLKINFHNSYSVYMHDTPSETLFGRNFRAASSGCVRVAGIEHLASWLLSDNGWSPERIAKMRETGEKVDVNLKKPVPLYFAYVTAWVTEDGIVNFRRDLYNKDGVGAIAGAY